MITSLKLIREGNHYYAVDTERTARNGEYSFSATGVLLKVDLDKPTLWKEGCHPVVACTKKIEGLLLLPVPTTPTARERAKYQAYEILSKFGKVQRRDCNPIAQATWDAFERGFMAKAQYEANRFTEEDLIAAVQFGINLGKNAAQCEVSEEQIKTLKKGLPSNFPQYVEVEQEEVDKIVAVNGVVGVISWIFEKDYDSSKERENWY